MKKLKHLLPLLLVAVLLLSLTPLGVFAQEDTSTDPADATPTPAAPGDIVSSGSDPETTTPPAETAAPTATPAPTPTAEPTPVPTAAPTETPAPTEAPEIAPPVVDGPSIEEPFGDGIVMGPNNPPENGPTIFSTISGTASIAVHNCYDSYGSQIKYYSSFAWNSKYIGGNGSPRYQITANGSPAYCIEPGGYLPGGSTVSTSTAHVWNGFSSDKRDAIKVALLCGEPGNSSALSGNFGSQYTATQLIIWELIVGARSTYSPYNCTDSKVINSVCGGGWNSEVKTVYDQISNAMRAYSILPSFANSLNAPPASHDMSYQNGAFTLTLTDSNGVLSNYNFTSTNGSLNFSVSGNQLTITSSSPVDSATVNVTKKNAVSVSSTITAYAGNGLQETIVGVEASDNTSGYFMVNAKGEAPPPAANASLGIRKTAEDGNVANINFTLVGIGGEANGAYYSVYTNDYGNILTEVKPGTYMVTEQTPSGYVASPKSQQVTLKSGGGQVLTFYNALEKGTVEIIKTSSDGVVGGIKFTLSGPDGSQTVTTGYDGKVKVPDLSPGSYTVTEQVPAGYTADQTTQRFTLMPGELYDVTFHNTPSKGNIKIIKTSDDGNVSGIKFTITGDGYNKTFPTDAKGVLNVGGMTPGTYTITEQVPDGYKSDNPSQTVSIKAGTLTTVNFHNIRSLGSIRIVKTSDDGKVSGIQFTVRGGSMNQTVTSGSDGTITIPNLTPGQYAVTETVPSGYTADQTSQTVTVKGDETTTVNFRNTLKTGNVKIVKTADDGKVSGIQFTVKGGSINKTVTSGSDGTITVPGLTPGQYTVTEQVPAAYACDNPSQTVTVEYDKTATVTFRNTLKTGSLKIVKTSDDGHISGIQFTVKGGSVDQTVTSGTDGTITVPGLVPGQYTVTENVPEGYVCEVPSQTVTVEYDKTAEVRFENELKMWRVAVTKVDADEGVRRSSRATLEGAQYGVYHDGTLQDTYTTDSGGHFTTNYYACGTGWTLQEINAPTGYTVDPNSYSIGLEPGTTQLAVNDTELTVPEEIIEGKLLITKQDGLTQTPLAGAVFTVMDETGATVTEATTGEDGTATVDSLPFGTYTAKETKAPEGYQLDETVFDFAIETDGQTVTLTRENVYNVGSITVHKADTQGNTLAGATYLLEWSQDGGLWQPVTFRSDTTPAIGGCTTLDLNAGQLTTGADGTVKFDGLVANGKVQYRLTETKAPEGLSLLKDPVFQGTLPFDAATGPLYDIAYTVTNNRITNLPQTGSSGLLLPVAVGTALLGLAGCAGFFVVRNRKKSKSN